VIVVTDQSLLTVQVDKNMPWFEQREEIIMAVVDLHRAGEAIDTRDHGTSDVR
jgi:hypothetical protein